MSIRIPSSWVESTFSELNQFESRTTDPAQHPQEEFELYSVPTFPTGKPEFLKGAAIGSTKQTVEPNDVLVCKINPRINRVWQVGDKQQFRQIASSEWIGFRSDVLNLKFYKHYFSSARFRELICTDLTGVGGSLTRAQPKRVATFPMPLAPLNEQKRIADKLDAVLVRVDACRDRLDRIPAILKRFRQSVLAAATSGKLTEEWRANQVARIQPQVESGNIVRDSAQSRYAVTSTPDAATLHSDYVACCLDKWEDVRLSDVIVDMRNGMAPKPTETPPGAKILRISAVRSGKLDLADHRYLVVTDKDATLYDLKKHDLLFTRYNGSLEYVGVCASLSSDAKGYVYPDKLIRTRVNGSIANSKFIEIVFGSEPVRRQIENFVKSSAGQKGISGSDLKSTRFLLPSILEQTEIVRRVESLFANADRLEARYAAARAQVEKLTPATLAKAFRGELVPQDPNDEPASELLERIKAQRNDPAEDKLKQSRKVTA